MAKETGRYNFYDKNRTGGSRASVILSVASILVFLVLTAAAAALGGNAGSWAGGFGFAGFALAFAGMIMGLSSFRTRQGSYTMSKVGTLTGGLMVAVWFLIFCVGLAQ